MTSLINELHWLHVKFCYEYKMATSAYRHFNHKVPSYLSALFCTYQTLFTASIWNSLPASLQNLPTLSWLKIQLKTFLFSIPVFIDYVYVYVQICVNGVC